jgi:hypothetical protein
MKQQQFASLTSGKIGRMRWQELPRVAANMMNNCCAG